MKAVFEAVVYENLSPKQFVEMASNAWEEALDRAKASAKTDFSNMVDQ